MSVTQKLAAARQFIKTMPVKKSGHNKYSDYDYFTPEQINHMVHEAEKETGLIHLFSLIRDEHGLHGYLVIEDLETGKSVEFKQATEIPQIKATNAAQQVGGAVTYTLRYMLQTAFGIADNSLDFDAQEPAKEEKPPAKKKPMPDERFKNMVTKLTKENAAEFLSLARKTFVFTDAQENALRDWEDNL